MSINKVTLLGRVGTIEAKQSKAGGCIVTLSIATDQNKKNQSGEWETETEWSTVLFFGKQAETLEKFVQKGHKLYVEGRLKTDKWEDDLGNKREKTKILGNAFDLIEGYGKKNEEKPVSTNRQSYANKDVPFDDDIPF